MKRKDELIIVLVWALLYLPYVIFGGLVRDDLGWLTLPIKFTNYLNFQWSMSTAQIMTARPVAAILHGLCYWYFGTAAWAYHLVNLTLFFGSVLFFYLALKKFISCDIALLSSLFALVYPCASGTIFSSIMMNSNLAAFFWSSALYTATKSFKGKYILITALLLLSSLSYEAFIPLFMLNILVGFIVIKSSEQDKQQLLIEALPSLAAIVLFGIYRVFIEKTIFNTSFSRIKTFSLISSLNKFLTSLKMGVKIALVDSVKISLHALNNLDLVSIYYLMVIITGLVFLGAYLYMKIKADNAENLKNSDYIQRFIKQHTTIQIDKFFYLDFCVLTILLYFCTHLIYVFSDYAPNSSGFENRTLGAIRFTTALSISIIAKSVWSILLNRSLKKLIALSLIGIFSLFTLSIIGQRESWIAAAHFNEQILSKINVTIREQHLDNIKSHTLVAILPSEFPGQINQEPIFGVPWDITPSLSLSNPTITIDANVYNSTTIASSDKITINGYWEAQYPFWLYIFEDNKIYQVGSKQDFFDYIK